MLLERTLIKLTIDLKTLCENKEKGISSHNHLKENRLSCLKSFIQNAPNSEYESLLKSKDHESILGYLIHTLCQIVEGNQSKQVKILALEVIYTLSTKLESLHHLLKEYGGCSVKLITYSLPRVSSILFKLISSDTKLPARLLINAISTLAKFITLAFYKCDHLSNKHGSANLTETCDNLSFRLRFLINYIITHDTNLSSDVKLKVLDLCSDIVCQTHVELIRRALAFIIEYVAFISPSTPNCNRFHSEIQLKNLIIIKNIQNQIENHDGSSGGNLETTVLRRLSKLLDELEVDYLSMLPSERQSKLSIFYGFLKILPGDRLTFFLELTEKRNQLLKMLTTLAEFSNQQPLLFITGTHVGDQALENIDEKIYTMEARFLHLNETEVILVDNICRLLGKNIDLLLLRDMLRSDLSEFSNPSSLYVIHNLLRGCFERNRNDHVDSSFTLHLVTVYIDQIYDKYLILNENQEITDANSSKVIVVTVIAIRTIITLVELHCKISKLFPEKMIILRILLCPLLNWASSSNRAISESALSSLAQLSILYDCDSTKSLIESNIDYIVDGVKQLLNNFLHNSHVVNILAITFKLSSLKSFYYFKDVYEQVFRLLEAYHQTNKSATIALLFYRTLEILEQRKETIHRDTEPPLKNDSSLRSVLQDLDIQRRIKKLEEDSNRARKLKESIEAMELEGETEEEVLEDLQTKGVPRVDEQSQKDDSPKAEVKKKRPPELELTEKILKHCINLISSNYSETKILALKTASLGFRILQDDEDTLLPLIHLLWSPLVRRLTSDYRENLEINLSAFDCLVSMALNSKDFIKRRTLDSVIPRLCLFLEIQSRQSKEQRDYGPYSMTIAYKCQLRILTQLGVLAFHIQLAYSNLWRIIKAIIIYLDAKQMESLRKAALISSQYLIALDADCMWYFAKKSGHLDDLPFELLYEAIN